MDMQHSKDMILGFFLSLFIISIVLLGWVLWPFLAILILACVVTNIFFPLYRLLLSKFKPAWASLITCLIVFVTLFVPIVLFVGILSKEAYEMYLLGRDALVDERLTGLITNNRVIDRLNSVLAPFNVQVTGEQLGSLLSEIGKTVGFFLYQQATAIGTNLLRFVGNFFLMILVVYFLLMDAAKLVQYIVDLSPLPRDQDEILIRKFKDMAGAIIIGNGLGGLIQGLLGGIIFALMGIKSALLWGVIMALLAFLPIVGIGIVFIPAAAWQFLNSQIGAGLFLMITYVILSGSVEYLLKPKIVGKRAQMPTLLVFLAVIGGLKLFGIMGIIYGPLMVTAFLALAEIYQVNYKKRVELENSF